MRSTRPDKKKMVYVRDPKTGKVKTIHFGARGYSKPSEVQLICIPCHKKIHLEGGDKVV